MSSLVGENKMNKVKIFCDMDPGKLEAAINQWFAENEDIEILNVVNGSTNGAVVISLFYREPEP